MMRSSLDNVLHRLRVRAPWSTSNPRNVLRGAPQRNLTCSVEHVRLGMLLQPMGGLGDKILSQQDLQPKRGKSKSNGNTVSVG
jgi:hypothetical protein